MPSAITMLKSDHATLKRLLGDLEKTTERAVKERERLIGEIEREIKMHSQLEEEIFYPAYLAKAKKTDAEDLFYEATEEHHVVDMVLPSLKSANPKSHEFSARAKVLKELVEHHIEEEEGEMFTKARKLLSDPQLQELGEMMQSRRDSLQAMWNNPLLRPVKKLQSVAQKFMPTKVKNVKVKAIAAVAGAKKR